MVESNLAVDRDFTWIEGLRRKGYRIALCFLGTEDMDQNVGRVKRRIQEGAHDVPAHIVRDRYRNIEALLKARFHLFDESVLLDNSSDEPVLVARLKAQQIVWQAEQIPM